MAKFLSGFLFLVLFVFLLRRILNNSIGDALYFKRQHYAEWFCHTSLWLDFTSLRCRAEKTHREGLRQYGPESLWVMKLNVRIELENTGLGKSKVTDECKKHSLFLYYDLLISIFFIWTSVNLLLPHAVWMANVASRCDLSSAHVSHERLSLSADS